MKVLGIIAEYNPFHNGHLFHLSESKKETEADFVVAVMSGDFVQRGEPALMDKWQRSKIAVENGIDLVIELPFVFACNNAEIFAMGAIDILNGLGCVTHLSFGSEEGSLDALNIISKEISNETIEFKKELQNNLNLGFSFPASREKAIKKVLGIDDTRLFKGSNNILAIEYLKQLNLTNSSILPITVKRKGPGYNEESIFENIASATLLRNMLEKGEDIGGFIPKETLDEVLKEEKFLYTEDLFGLIRYKLITESKDNLSTIYSITEGLENRIKKAIYASNSSDQLVEKIISKRYTETRIKRILIHSILNLYRDSFNHIVENKVNYGRVLAFNHKGSKLLKHIKKHELNKIPIITNINKEIQPKDSIFQLLNYDVMASDVYNLVRGRDMYNDSDFVKMPFIKI